MDTVLGAKQSRGEGREEHPDLPTPCRDPPAGLHEKGAETEELDGGMPSADETGQEGHAGANEPTSSRGPNRSRRRRLHSLPLMMAVLTGLAASTGHAELTVTGETGLVLTIDRAAQRGALAIVIWSRTEKRSSALSSRPTFQGNSACHASAAFPIPGPHKRILRHTAAAFLIRPTPSLLTRSGKARALNCLRKARAS